MFGKSKPVVLELYTSDPAIFKYSKWENANKHKPSWWKRLNIPGKNQEEANMKHCAGFNDLYSNAITVPMWCEFRANIPPIGIDQLTYEFANPKAGLDIHPENQRNNFLPDSEYQHMKLLSPWVATCEEPVEFLMTNTFWDMPEPFSYFVPNGVINFKHQAASHVNIVVKKDVAFKKLFVQQGTPLVLLVPLTERKLVLKYNLISEEEFRRLYEEKNASLWFTQKYYKAKKCPFH